MPPNIPKRGQKKINGNVINSDTATIQQQQKELNTKSNCSGYLLCADADKNDLRDSGISVSDQSNLNNFNNVTCYEDFDLNSHQQEMNISTNCCDNSLNIESPPPIPPKSNISLNSSFDFGNSLERKKNDHHSVLESGSGNITNTNITATATTTENYSEPKSHHNNCNENGEENTETS